MRRATLEPKQKTRKDRRGAGANERCDDDEQEVQNSVCMCVFCAGWGLIDKEGRRERESVERFQRCNTQLVERRERGEE